MTKKIKFIVLTLVMAFGFFFCCSLVSVSADDGSNEPAEPTTEEVIEVTDEEVDSFVDHLKDLKWDEAEAIIAAFCVKLGVDALTILGFIIWFVLKKTAQVKESKAFKEALAKMTLEQQEETQKLVNNFENELMNIYEENQKILNEYKQKLEELTNDQTKEIAAELSKVTDCLNED